MPRGKSAEYTAPAAIVGLAAAFPGVLPPRAHGSGARIIGSTHDEFVTPSFPPSKPAGETQTVAPCGHHLVLASGGEENGQAPGRGLDKSLAPEVVDDLEFTAVVRPPAPIEVERQRYAPLTAPARLIDVARVTRPGRIPRVVHLQLEQAEKGFTIQSEPHLLERTEQLTLRGQERFGQPADRIAANIRSSQRPPLSADARGYEVAPLPPRVGTTDQLVHLRLRQESIADGDSVAAEFGLQALRTLQTRERLAMQPAVNRHF